MRLTRVFTPDRLIPGDTVVLSAMASAHLIKVLRLRAGARTLLFNGDGMDYLGEIVLPKAEAANVQLLSAQPACAESTHQIALIQAICRGEKMDWVLEKATELGVYAVQPVHSERAEVHLDAERAVKRREHWQRVVISACEQSGRAHVPPVAPLLALDACMALAKSDSRAGREKSDSFGLCVTPRRDTATATAAPLKLILVPGAPPLRQALAGRTPSSTQIAIGPEGGWSERDLAQLQLGGFTPVSLGPRVLRTETAGLAAISALQTLLGDF
jgi:16S rRNA (uracil1498-N3)-methyltransferase